MGHDVNKRMATEQRRCKSYHYQQTRDALKKTDMGQKVYLSRPSMRHLPGLTTECQDRSVSGNLAFDNKFDDL